MSEGNQVGHTYVLHSILSCIPQTALVQEAKLAKPVEITNANVTDFFQVVLYVTGM